MSGDTERGTSPRPDPADLRASDAERDDVATALGDHFQAGRLSQAEFDDRVTAALGARTRRDLSILLTDLPTTPARVAEVTGGVWGRGGAGVVQPGRTGGIWGRGEAGVVEPGGVWGRRSRARVLPVLVPLLVAAFITAGLATHGWGAGDAGHHAAGPWPLLLLWWVIPLVAFRIRRRRWAQRAASAGRQGPWQ
jgi:hypothetical protein